MSSIKPDRKEQRKFFLIVVGLLGSLAGWKLYRGRPETASILAIAGALFLFLEFVVPAISNFLFDRWMQFAHFLGTVNTYVLVTLVFWGVLTPVSYLVRMFSKTSARIANECRARGSAWLDLPTELDRERYRQPY